MKKENNEIIKNENTENKIEKLFRRKSFFQKKHFNEDYIISLLQKPGKTRTKNEIRIISEYLSEKYDYFKKIKENSEIEKLEKICSVIKYETFNKDETIISYGEEGDKFYILLNGKVNLYRPIYSQKKLTLKEYIIYLNSIKNDDKTGLKYDRIIEKNKYLNIDLNFYMSIPFTNIVHYGYFQIYVEEYEKIGEFENGFTFGEMALIKKTKRNATIIAFNDCQLVSINKNDYNKIIKELELKRIEIDLKSFKIKYPSFLYWNISHLIKLIHYFKKEILYNTDYLFKQNEESDFIYIIENGNFDLYCYLSLGWIKEYYNYIEYSKSNLIIFLFGKSPIDDEEIDNLFLKAKNKKIESPMIFNHNNNEIYTISTPKKLNFVEFENEQIKNFDNNNLFKIKIKTISNPDILGFEDSLELKNRFYFAKCVSEKAEVKKINIKDFHKLISTLDNENNKKFLIEMIKTRKDNFLKIIKNEVDMKLNKINNEFENNFIDFLKGKGKFSYDKIDEKKKNKYLVKQVSIKKINYLNNNKRISKPHLKIRPNNSQINNLKINSLNLNRINLPNLTYSTLNIKNENKIQLDKHIISDENNFLNKESDTNIISNKKLIMPINLRIFQTLNKSSSRNNLTSFRERKKSNEQKSIFNNYKTITTLFTDRNKNSRNQNTSLFNQTSKETILFNTENYKKNIGKDKFLAAEVIRLAGITKVSRKRIIHKNNDTILTIQSKFLSPDISNYKNKNLYFKTIDHFSNDNFNKKLKSNSSNKGSNKNNIFINDRIRAEIRMKDFRSLRFKKKHL